MTQGVSQGGLIYRMLRWFHHISRLNRKTQTMEEELITVKPFSPRVGQPAENFLAGDELKSDTRGLLQAAKNRIESETTANVLEKLGVGGSGKTKTSSDLEGIAALAQVFQGSADKKMEGANQILMGLLARKDNQGNGTTQDNWMADVIKQVMAMKMMMTLLKEDQPQQDGMGAQWIAFFQASKEQDRQHQAQIIDMMNNFHSQRYQDLQERSGPDPITNQIYSQILPKIVGEAVGQARKSPVDHLVELKDSLDKLGGTFNLFGGNNPGATTPEERIKMRQMELDEKRIASEERDKRRDHYVKHNAPMQWGKGLGNLVGTAIGNGSQMSQDSTLAGMMGGMDPASEVDL